MMKETGRSKKSMMSGYSVNTTHRMKHTMNSMKTNSRTFAIEHPDKNDLEVMFTRRQRKFDDDCEAQIDIITKFTVIRTK